MRELFPRIFIIIPNKSFYLKINKKRKSTKSFADFLLHKTKKKQKQKKSTAHFRLHNVYKILEMRLQKHACAESTRMLDEN